MPARVSCYVDGGTPSLLDVVDVPVLNPQPNGHQQENWLLDASRHWTKVGSVELADLPKWIDTPDTLWHNGNSSSKGQNDRVKTSDANSLDSSLCLIKVNLEVCVLMDSERKRVQGCFRYKGMDYCLWVTDDDKEKEYLQWSNGNYGIGGCYLTISLSGPYNGYSYKLIAAVIDS